MGDKVDYLYEPAGQQLHWDGLKSETQPGPLEQLSNTRAATARKGLGGTSASQAGGYKPVAAVPPTGSAPKAMSPAELMRLADEMLEKQHGQNQAQLDAGASVSGNGTVAPEWLRNYMGDEDSDLGF